MTELNILLTCVGREQSPALINQVYKISKKEHLNVKIIGIDNDNNAIGKYFVDNFIVSPLGNAKTYISFIKKIIKKYNINLIIPRSDEEALTLSKSKPQIEKLNAIITTSTFKNINIFSNKILTYRELNKIGLGPKSWDYANNKNELINKVKLRFLKSNKCIIKPAIARGGKNIFLISNNKNKKANEISLNNFLDKKKIKYPYVIMSELNNPILDVDFLCKDGQLINYIARERKDPLKPNNGNRIVKNNYYKTIAKKIANHFNLTWIFDLDIMYDNAEEPVIIEINPRMSGSFSSGVALNPSILINIFRIYRNHNLLIKDKFIKKETTPYSDLLII
jgi:carbamoyl-phosphate synthase large subunit